MTQPPPDIHAKAFLQDTTPATPKDRLLDDLADIVETQAALIREQVEELKQVEELIKGNDFVIELRKENDQIQAELDHFYGLCVDDPGKNPPLFWKDVAAEQKTLIQELVAVLKPFAEEEPEHEAISEDNELVAPRWLDATYGQYRAAREAFAKAKTQGYEP